MDLSRHFRQAEIFRSREVTDRVMGYEVVLHRSCLWDLYIFGRWRLEDSHPIINLVEQFSRIEVQTPFGGNSVSIHISPGLAFGSSGKFLRHTLPIEPFRRHHVQK